MRVFTALARSVLLATLGAPLLAQPLAPQELENDRYIRVVDQADRGEMVILVGPVDLPAGTTHEGAHAAQVPLQVITFPRAGWLHGFVTDMVDATGAPLVTSYLHHVNVIDPENRELFSPISRRIMAAGPETGEKELPSSMGLPIEEGQRLLVRAVFHNPTAESHSELYLRIRFSFTPSQAGSGRANVFPVYMDVKPPVGSKSFNVPPGVSSQSWEGRPAVSGRLLAAAGHMHDFGTGLRLEDVTEGRLLWETKPVVDAERRVESIPIGSFWKKGGIPLRSDHVYRLTVTYDNPTGQLLPDGGMGTMGGVFIPEPGEVWPEVDQSDSDYLADLEHTRGRDVDGMGDGHHAAASAPGAAGDTPAETSSGPSAEPAISPSAGANHEGHEPR